MHDSFKLLRVDLSQRTAKIEEVAPGLMEKYIGGSGLGAKILWDETTANTDAFSPENRLMFMIGPLTGHVPLGSRFAVCGLSPASGAWGEATAGGRWGLELSRTGLTGIVFVGRAEKPVYLYVGEQGPGVRDARNVWGRDTWDTAEILNKEHGQEACVACIGQAGENLVRVAAVMTEGRVGRAAARCGMGAVMGSKNLKAVVVKGKRAKPEIADEAALKATNRQVTDVLVKIRKGAGGGVPQIRDVIATFAPIGNVPIRNQSRATTGLDAFLKTFIASYP